MAPTIDLRTELPGPRSTEILARKQRVIADAKSLYLPIVIDHAHGVAVTDGAVWVTVHGPRLTWTWPDRTMNLLPMLTSMPPNESISVTISHSRLPGRRRSTTRMWRSPVGVLCVGSKPTHSRPGSQASTHACVAPSTDRG